MADITDLRIAGPKGTRPTSPIAFGSQVGPGGVIIPPPTVGGIAEEELAPITLPTMFPTAPTTPTLPGAAAAVSGAALPTVTPAAPVAPTAAPEFDLAAFLGIGQPADITAQKEAQLGVTQELIGLAEADIAERRALAETDIQEQLQRQAELLETAFAPRLAAIEEAGQATQEAAAFAAAARGSVRGSRQAEKQVEISEKTGQALAAAEAEKAMQLQLAEAQLRGASEAQLESLNTRLQGLRDTRTQLESEVALAQEGLLAEQSLLAQEAQEQQLNFILDRLSEQGLTIDPFTGQTVSTIDGEKLKSDIAKKTADTAKIYAELQKPDVQVKYFTDELGNVTANLINLSTGETENIGLGKLGSAEKWALSALGVGLGAPVTVSGGAGGAVVTSAPGVPTQAAPTVSGLPQGDAEAAAQNMFDRGFPTSTILQDPAAVSQAYGLTDDQTKQAIASLNSKYVTASSPGAQAFGALQFLSPTFNPLNLL